jgi:DNA-binding NtrC family response regulator
MVSRGEFREDLYFRLSVMGVELPPLRDRGEDVIMIAERFLDAFRAIRGQAPTLGIPARTALLAERWPGNVRELKNTIERAAYLAGATIEPSDLHLGRRPPPPPPPSASAEPGQGHGGFPEELFASPFKTAKQELIDEFERRYFARLLTQTGGNLSRAAAEAGITRYYLRELVKRLNIPRSGVEK